MIQFPTTGDWHGCYGKSWKGVIADESFSHPAKFSRGLIYRIYQYLSQEKLTIPGNTIFDPFGGVALGALPALQHGCNWFGLELESKFVAMGQENIALWENRYRGKLPGWQGEAVLLQGDSRRLAEVLQGDFFAVVTSPPFAGNGGGRGEASRNGIDSALFDRHQGAMVGGIGNKANGNLGSLPQTDFQAVVTSPPFVDSVGSDEPEKRGGLYRDPKRKNDKSLTGTYGKSEGQLGTMKAGPAHGIVTSPPYENSVNQADGANDTEARSERMKQAGIDIAQSVNVGGPNSTYNQAQIYGTSNGQIGTTSGDTFWAAAKMILEQCYQVLQTGGVAAFVCKDFVKNWQRVPFSGQWSQLCVAVGFESVAHFRAWQVKPGPVQTALIGDDRDYTKEYKSFFRRDKEKKGSPRIDWEDVVIFRKP